MKKITILFLSLMTMSLVSVSCNKDDDGGSASLEGTWEFSKEGFILMGQEMLEDYIHTEGCEKDHIIIQAGGTMTETTFYKVGETCMEDTENGTWVRSGNTITVTMDGETEELQIVSLTNTTLKVMLAEMSAGGSGYVAVFVRK